ncbi:MAG: hypothetical protein ABIL09_06140 [Gemmatimonadota bacterium]
MIELRHTTARRAPQLPPENEMSRRYLRQLEAWMHVGAEYFQPWPERPDCGHFFGGCHWYGQETAGPALACAVAARSEEYDEAAAGVTRQDLRRMALAGVRYLAFTHDTGPPECLRPARGLGRPENCSTKWGERGLGFFRESQCGTTLSAMAEVCLLLRDQVDEETWLMVARIHADYAERFGAMAPRSGVYYDTQMEENAWTACGLTSCCLFLEQHPDAAAWEAAARRWMFSACAAPQDARDGGLVGDAAARELAGRTFTALPDYWAENHGMVHPSYTAAGVLSLKQIGCLLGLWGRPLPPELFWNRRPVYANLKPVTDGAGQCQPVQGMDWHYLPATGPDAVHAAAAVFLGDPEAAALQRRALQVAELRQRANAGRFYDRTLAERSHDQQDPMIMREITVRSPAGLQLMHRLFGPGPAPASEAELAASLDGARLYPHAGIAHHRHGRGLTSLAWRNSIMALPLPAEGIYAIAPARDTWLGRPEVEGRPDSHRVLAAATETGDTGFATALSIDRCQGALRQEVLFASFADGRVLSCERFRARVDLTLAALDQGLLQVVNECFPELAAAWRAPGPAGAAQAPCRGQRLLTWAGGAEVFPGGIADDDSADVLRILDPPPAWVNVDGRLGIAYRGSGFTVYLNRHYFRPYRAVADDLVLSRQAGLPRPLRAGEEAGRLAALLAPGQAPADTAAAALQILEGPADTLGLRAGNLMAVASFACTRRVARFAEPRRRSLPLFPGAGAALAGDRMEWAVTLEANRAAGLTSLGEVEVEGEEVRVDVTADGRAYAHNLGSAPAHLRGPGQDRTARLEPGQVVAL